MIAFWVTLPAMPVRPLQGGAGPRGAATVSRATLPGRTSIFRPRTLSVKQRAARKFVCRRPRLTSVRPCAVAMRSETNGRSIDEEGKPPSGAETSPVKVTQYIGREGDKSLQAVPLNGKFEYFPADGSGVSSDAGQPLMAVEEAQRAPNGATEHALEGRHEAEEQEVQDTANCTAQVAVEGRAEGKVQTRVNGVKQATKQGAEEEAPVTANLAGQAAEARKEAQAAVFYIKQAVEYSQDTQANINGAWQADKEENAVDNASYEMEEVKGGLPHVDDNTWVVVEGITDLPVIDLTHIKATTSAEGTPTASLASTSPLDKLDQPVERQADKEHAVDNASCGTPEVKGSPPRADDNSWVVVEGNTDLPVTDLTHIKPTTPAARRATASLASSPPLDKLDPEILVRVINKVQRKNLQLQKKLTEAEFHYNKAANTAEERLAEIEQLKLSKKTDGVDEEYVDEAEEEYEVQPVSSSHEERDDVLAGDLGEVTSAYCAIQHPGVQCCTDVSVAKDKGSTECVVTVRTSARHCGDQQAISSSLNMPHMLALAGQAMLTSVSDFCQENNRGLASSMFTQRRTDRHKYLKKVLHHGTVVDVLDRRVSQFGHENLTIRLQDPDSTDVITAVFKPRVPGDGRGWHRAPIEAVAYKLNLLLGMDRVPPVAYRTGGIDVNYQHYDEGAFIYFSPNCSELQEHDEDTWGVDKDILLSDIRVLDVLLHNSDRHHGHILMGDHWVEGHWVEDVWMGNKRPMLIDHAAGFRKEAFVTMKHDNAFQTGAVTRVSARTYLRLRFLDAATIASNFSRYLSEREMRELLMRRNAILRYFDQLVELKGYENTVAE